jgi:hypothetical protein
LISGTYDVEGICGSPVLRGWDDDLTIRQPQSVCSGCVVNPASDAQFVLLVGFFARLGAHRQTKTPDGCVCMYVCMYV